MVATLVVMTATVATPVAIPTSHKMIQILAAILAVAAEPTPVAEPMKWKAPVEVQVVLVMVTVPVKALVKA